MHSECSSPPTTNYNIANNNGQDGFPNGSYVMSNGKNNNNMEEEQERRENSNQLNNLVHDQDISQIVDQVLSCIDQFEDLNDANHSG